MNVNNDEIIALENIILKIVSWGLGGVLCLVGVIVMAVHTFLKLSYPDWLITGLVSLVIGFTLVMTHTIFNFIIKLKRINQSSK